MDGEKEKVKKTTVQRSVFYPEKTFCEFYKSCTESGLSMHAVSIELANEFNDSEKLRKKITKKIKKK